MSECSWAGGSDMVPSFSLLSSESSVHMKENSYRKKKWSNGYPSEVTTPVTYLTDTNVTTTAEWLVWNCFDWLYFITSVRQNDLKNSEKTRTKSTVLGEQEDLDAGMWRVAIRVLPGHMTWKIVKLHTGRRIWSLSLNSKKI